MCDRRSLLARTWEGINYMITLPKNFNDWERVEFREIATKDRSIRDIANESVQQDLEKQVQQLMFDVHEECIANLKREDKLELVYQQLQKLINVQKRMASLTTVLSLQGAWITWIVTWTAVLGLFLGAANFALDFYTAFFK
jgi:hypothetical protein